jgi:nitroreductase
MSEVPDTTNDIWETMWTQRAIRYFRPDPIPEDVVRKLIEAATRAPNGQNRQAWAFMVVQDAELRKRIGDEVAVKIGQQPAFKVRVDTGAKSDDRTTRLMMAGGRNLADNLASAPLFILPCIVGPHVPGMDRLLLGSSAYLATQNVMLAARALGLGTVMTIFHVNIMESLREWLELPEDITPVALIPVGYTDAKFGPVKREPIENVTHWDRWGLGPDGTPLARPVG